jgi:hypothetical protein
VKRVAIVQETTFAKLLPISFSSCISVGSLWFLLFQKELTTETPRIHKDAQRAQGVVEGPSRIVLFLLISRGRWKLIADFDNLLGVLQYAFDCREFVGVFCLTGHGLYLCHVTICRCGKFS